MNSQQQQAFDEYLKASHLSKRLKPEHYHMFDIPGKLLRLTIAEQVLSDNGLYDDYIGLIDFLNSIHDAVEAVKQ